MNTACFNLLYSKILYLKSFKPLPAIPSLSPEKGRERKQNSLLFFKKRAKVE